MSSPSPAAAHVNPESFRDSPAMASCLLHLQLATCHLCLPLRCGSEAGQHQGAGLCILPDDRPLHGRQPIQEEPVPAPGRAPGGVQRQQLVLQGQRRGRGQRGVRPHHMFSDSGASECLDYLSRAPAGITTACPGSRSVNAAYNVCVLRYSSAPIPDAADLDYEPPCAPPRLTPRTQCAPPGCR
jgi:hypothetical protein